jgi:hypothetical protein
MLFWFMFYAKIHQSQNPRTIGRARFLRRNFWAPFIVIKQIYDLCKKIVIIYAGLVHVLR